MPLGVYTSFCAVDLRWSPAPPPSLPLLALMTFENWRFSSSVIWPSWCSSSLSRYIKQVPLDLRVCHPMFRFVAFELRAGCPFSCFFHLPPRHVAACVALRCPFPPDAARCRARQALPPFNPDSRSSSRRNHCADSSPSLFSLSVHPKHSSGYSLAAAQTWVQQTFPIFSYTLSNSSRRSVGPYEYFLTIFGRRGSLVVTFPSPSS